MSEVSWSTDGGNVSPETMFKRLMALPDAIYGKNGGIVRQILFQVAKIPELKAKAIAPHKTGRLQGAIRKRRDRNPQFENANENYQVYVYKGKTRDDPKGAWYWTFVHFKTKKNQKAVPFLTIAFESSKAEMIAAFRETFKRKLILAENKVKKLK